MDKEPTDVEFTVIDQGPNYPGNPTNLTRWTWRDTVKGLYYVLAPIILARIGWSLFHTYHWLGTP